MAFITAGRFQAHRMLQGGAAVGAILMVIATLCFVSMQSLIRQIGGELPPVEVAFFRNLFGFLAIAPIFLRHGLEPLKNQAVAAPRLSRRVAGCVDDGVLYWRYDGAVCGSNVHQLLRPAICDRAGGRDPARENQAAADASLVRWIYRRADRPPPGVCRGWAGAGLIARVFLGMGRCDRPHQEDVINGIRDDANCIYGHLHDAAHATACAVCLADAEPWSNLDGWR